ncbi:MAG: hypothetical protein II155_02840 [Clostridia bacterium]|nr:hypothetical protein [Clostridia bacterium]
MKRFLIYALAVSITASAALLCGCGGGSQSVDIFTPDPGSSVIRPVPTPVPDFTPDPGGAVTPAPTDRTTEPPDDPASADQSVFDDAAFIGNSVFEGFYRFGVITHGKFFTKVGLNVNSVYTDHTDTGTVPIIDEVGQGSYGKVIIQLGQNELAWPNTTAFIQKYSDLIDDIMLRQPGARVFIVALPPVTKAYNDADQTGVNNENITRMNGLLKELAIRRGVVFIEVPEELYDEAGALPEDASSDGLHLNLKYDRIWADHICLSVMKAS